MGSATATRVNEARNFDEARAAFGDPERRAEGVETMMRLALHGLSPVRRWAGMFLEENCDLRVALDPTEGNDHAASPASADFR